MCFKDSLFYKKDLSVIRCKCASWVTIESHGAAKLMIHIVMLQTELLHWKGRVTIQGQIAVLA